MDVEDVPELVGSGVRLRGLRDGDVARRASLGRNREIIRGFGGDLDADEAMPEQEAADELRRRFGPGPHWVIADRHDLFVGIVRLAPVDAANRSARLGIGILDPAHLGQGLGTEAIRLALAYGFDRLGLHRVSLTVLADNARAVAAYTRCGFVVEGCFRDTLFRDGTWHDDLSMAILEPQWRAHAGSFTRVEDCDLDIESFQRWAAGNLVGNRNRGVFAEWLVGQALHAIGESEFREEWDVWDLQYRGAGIEVKTSGLSQYWSPLRRSRPSFRISVPKQIWCEQTAEWQANDQATRPAQVYVFCLHTSLPATNANVACPKTWKFWVILGRTLDDELGAQKTVRPVTLDRLAERGLAERVGWNEIKEAVDRLVCLDHLVD